MTVVSVADVRHLPVHPRSAQWLTHMSTSVDLHPDFGPSFGAGPNYGIPVTLVNGLDQPVGPVEHALRPLDVLLAEEPADSLLQTGGGDHPGDRAGDRRRACDR